MKSITLIAFITFTTQVSAAGFFHNSVLVDSPKAGAEFYSAINLAQTTGQELDACYQGNYRNAIDTTEKKAKSAIMFKILSAYGDNQKPTIDLEVYNDKIESVRWTFEHCL